jgi:hypothetical protein
MMYIPLFFCAERQNSKVSEIYTSSVFVLLIKLNFSILYCFAIFNLWLFQVRLKREYLDARNKLDKMATPSNKNTKVNSSVLHLNYLC